MDTTTVLIILAILLYLFVGFAVAIVHFLGSSKNEQPTGLKFVFLAPFIGFVWLWKKVAK